MIENYYFLKLYIEQQYSRIPDLKFMNYNKWLRFDQMIYPEIFSENFWPDAVTFTRAGDQLDWIFYWLGITEFFLSRPFEKSLLLEFLSLNYTRLVEPSWEFPLKT